MEKTVKLSDLEYYKLQNIILKQQHIGLQARVLASEFKHTTDEIGAREGGRFKHVDLDQRVIVFELPDSAASPHGQHGGKSRPPRGKTR